MSGQQLLNTTLKINALFSLFSGLDFVIFDRAIVNILTGSTEESVMPTGIMLIGFAVFVFLVSTMSRVNKFLVGLIIALDVLWVLGSVALVAAGADALTAAGQILILLVAAVIAGFAFFQTMGLRRHLAGS